MTKERILAKIEEEERNQNGLYKIFSKYNISDRKAKFWKDNFYSSADILGVIDFTFWGSSDVGIAFTEHQILISCDNG